MLRSATYVRIPYDAQMVEGLTVRCYSPPGIFNIPHQAESIFSYVACSVAGLLRDTFCNRLTLHGAAESSDHPGA